MSKRVTGTVGSKSSSMITSQNVKSPCLVIQQAERTVGKVLKIIFQLHCRVWGFFAAKFDLLTRIFRRGGCVQTNSLFVLFLSISSSQGGDGTEFDGRQEGGREGENG